MARNKYRQKALELRLQGKSYSQIKNELGISKSTLSDWLHNYPLSREQLRLLRDYNQVRIEKYRQTMQLRRESRLSNIYDLQRQELLPLYKEMNMREKVKYWSTILDIPVDQFNKPYIKKPTGRFNI